MHRAHATHSNDPTRPSTQVVLSGAICTKNGKALMARQFVEMSRIRIEGLLAAFPKLLGSGEEKQHTFIETDTVRCVRALAGGVVLILICFRGWW
jgi:coatomer subunit delta